MDAPLTHMYIDAIVCFTVLLYYSINSVLSSVSPLFKIKIIQTNDGIYDRNVSILMLFMSSNFMSSRFKFRVGMSVSISM